MQYLCTRQWVDRVTLWKINRVAEFSVFSFNDLILLCFSFSFVSQISRFTIFLSRRRGGPEYTTSLTLPPGPRGHVGCWLRTSCLRRDLENAARASVPEKTKNIGTARLQVRRMLHVLWSVKEPSCFKAAQTPMFDWIQLCSQNGDQLLHCLMAVQTDFR